MASTTTRPPAPLPSRPTPSEQPDAEQTAVEPYRLTPKLARRVALLGALVVIGFAALFLRLWALQVLAGTQYAAQAQANQFRTVRVQAPRGPIVDRERQHPRHEQAGHGGPALAGRPAEDLRAATAELRALAHVTRVPVRHVTQADRQAHEQRATCSTRSSSAPRRPARCSRISRSRPAAFPGVTLARSYVRHYPYGSLAAQLLGYVGQISQEQLKTLGKAATSRATSSARPGSSRRYDRYLRGVPGDRRASTSTRSAARAVAALADGSRRSRGTRCA